MTTVICDQTAYFYGYLGSAAALVFASLGSAYGVAKSGIGFCAAGKIKPSIIIKNTVPSIMASIVGIYGLIISIVITTKISDQDYSFRSGYSHLAAGLAVGLSGVAAGISLGIVGDVGVRANALQQKIYGGMILILIFGEALGLYGLIVGLILAVSSDTYKCQIQ